MPAAVLSDIQNRQMESENFNQADHGIHLCGGQAVGPHGQKRTPHHPEIQNEIFRLEITLGFSE